MLNIGQFLDEKPEEGDHTPWLYTPGCTNSHWYPACSTVLTVIDRQRRRMRQNCQMSPLVSLLTGPQMRLLLDSHDLFVSTQCVHFACAAHLRDALCVHFAHIEIYIRGNDQGNTPSLLTLVFRFDVIFHRPFGGRFCRDNEHLWCHANEEVADFHTLTFQREMGMALDML